MSNNRQKLLDAARRYSARGQYDKAAREYRSLLQHDPGDRRLWLLLADCLRRTGELEAAVKCFVRVGESYEHDEDYRKAVAVYRQALASDPANEDLQYRCARIFTAMGRKAEAVECYERLAQSCLNRGEVDAAIAHFRTELRIDPESVSRRLRLAELFSREGRRDEAVSEFRICSELLLQREDYAQYVRVAERLLFHQELPEVLRRLIQVYLYLDQPRRALVKLNALLQRDPGDFEALELLAETFLSLGKRDKGLSVIVELARTSEGQGETAEAAASRAVLRGLDEMPDHPELLAIAERLSQTVSVPGAQAKPGAVGDAIGRSAERHDTIELSLEDGDGVELSEEDADDDPSAFDRDALDLSPSAGRASGPGGAASSGYGGGFGEAAVSSGENALEQGLAEVNTLVKFRLFEEAKSVLDLLAVDYADQAEWLQGMIVWHEAQQQREAIPPLRLLLSKKLIRRGELQAAQSELSILLTEVPGQPQAQAMLEQLGRMIDGPLEETQAADVYQESAVEPVDQVEPAAARSELASDVAQDLAPDRAPDRAPDLASDLAPDVSSELASDLASDLAPERAPDRAETPAQASGYNAETFGPESAQPVEPARELRAETLSAEQIEEIEEFEEIEEIEDFELIQDDDETNALDPLAGAASSELIPEAVPQVVPEVAPETAPESLFQAIEDGASEDGGALADQDSSASGTHFDALSDAPESEFDAIVDPEDEAVASEAAPAQAEEFAQSAAKMEAMGPSLALDNAAPASPLIDPALAQDEGESEGGPDTLNIDDPGFAGLSDSPQLGGGELLIELGELDFFIEEGLFDDANELFDDLCARYGEEHPELAGYRTRLSGMSAGMSEGASEWGSMEEADAYEPPTTPEEPASNKDSKAGESSSSWGTSFAQPSPLKFTSSLSRLSDIAAKAKKTRQSKTAQGANSSPVSMQEGRADSFADNAQRGAASKQKDEDGAAWVARLMSDEEADEALNFLDPVDGDLFDEAEAEVTPVSPLVDSANSGAIFDEASSADNDNEEDLYLASIFSDDNVATLASSTARTSANSAQVVTSTSEGAPADTRYELAIAYHDMGLDENAKEELLACLEDHEVRFRASLLLGVIEREQGELASAKTHIEQALAWAEDQDEKTAAGYELGVSLQEMSENEAARAYFADLPPSFRDVRKRLSSIANIG